MAERIGIVAVAQTKYQPDRSEVNEGELVYETIEQVLEETGLGYADALNDDGTGIDSIVTCSSDAWDGRTISGMGVMTGNAGIIIVTEMSFVVVAKSIVAIFDLRDIVALAAKGIFACAERGIVNLVISHCFQ